MEINKYKVLLFAMTGLGNNALKVLLKHPSIRIIAVFTPEKEAGPFPYYECEKMQDVVLRSGIALYEGLNFKDEKTYDIIKKLSPDIIIVSSFNQIIPKSIISIPKLGVINIHPSLLPKYRGATPTVWALMNGEKETGVTIHFIEDERIDNGCFITQSRLQIEPADTDGALRFKLAALSENALIEALRLVLQNDKSKFLAQNESEATYYQKRSLMDAEIDINKPFNDIINKIRAMTPYPGAVVKCGDKKYTVKFAELLKGRGMRAYGANKGYLVIKTMEGITKFHIV
ncbi:MAG: methionyl-tRNA formyltransferase [Deltaproteobacteria bacterium]|nr:methionyl-tRNA formyltransferase [Deltaproteobacteria bacterium]